MKTTLKIIIFLAVFACLAVNQTTTWAEQWTPGVAKGDYFVYEMYGVFTAKGADLTFDIPPFERNTTDWARIDITEVVGSTVYQTYTLQFKDGNQTSFNFKTDLNPVANRNLSFSEKGVPICAANLKIGDQIPTAELVITQTFVSPKGEVNRASWNYSDDWGNCYFDKATGMLVELCRTHRFSSGILGEVIEKTDVVKLISTNRWKINESAPPSTSAFSSMEVILVFALFVLSLKVLLKPARLLRRKI